MAVLIGLAWVLAASLTLQESAAQQDNSAPPSLPAPRVDTPQSGRLDDNASPTRLPEPRLAAQPASKPADTDTRRPIAPDQPAAKPLEKPETSGTVRNDGSARQGRSAKPVEITPQSPSSAPAAGGTGGGINSTEQKPADYSRVNEIISSHSPVPITEPYRSASVGPVKPAPPPKPPLPVDGTMMVDQLGKLGREDQTGWFTMRFDQADEVVNKSRRLLPNPMLERIIDLAVADPSIVFKVSGETLVFRDHSYLLIRTAEIYSRRELSDETRPMIQPEKTAPEKKPSSDQPKNAGDSASSAQTQPAEDEPASPDEIIKRMMKDKPGTPILAPAQNSGTEPERITQTRPITSLVAQTEPAETIVNPPKPSMVVDRVIRILPHKLEGWFQARFESDNTFQDPPMLLLPCLLIERTEKKFAEGTKIRVTGEITTYRGVKYLLIRKVLPERNMGQF